MGEVDGSALLTTATMINPGWILPGEDPLSISTTSPLSLPPPPRTKKQTSHATIPSSLTPCHPPSPPHPPRLRNSMDHHSLCCRGCLHLLPQLSNLQPLQTRHHRLPDQPFPSPNSLSLLLHHQSSNIPRCHLHHPLPAPGRRGSGCHPGRDPDGFQNDLHIQPFLHGRRIHRSCLLPHPFHLHHLTYHRRSPRRRRPSDPDINLPLRRHIPRYRHGLPASRRGHPQLLHHRLRLPLLHRQLHQPVLPLQH